MIDINDLFESVFGEPLESVTERKSEIVRTDRGVKKDDHNEKNMRKIDVINSQYKRGKITKEERDKKVDEINLTNKSQFRGIPPVQYPKDGTDNEKYKVNYRRPSNMPSNKSKDKVVKQGNCIHGELSEESLKKFNYHFRICKTTDDYREYLTHRKELCKIVQIPQNSIISKGNFNRPENFGLMVWENDGKNANLPKGTVLYHTSDVRNLTRLNGKFRGKEGRLFPTQRVYFHVGKPGGRMMSASDNFMKNHPDMHCYVYTGDVSNAKIDNEIGGSSVYIETNTSLPVREMTTKTVKESEENYMNAETLVTYLMESFIEERANSSKGGDPDIPDSIEPVVDTLESKGYMVKYSSPGYANTRFDNDKNKDGIINAKLVSTARIIFSRDYNFSKTPQGWEWKVMNNGAKALYAKQYTYNEKMGTKKEAFQKWKAKYMQSIKDWAASLPQVGTKDPDKTPDENFNSNKR